MNRWFRMYDEILDDPKVQKLSPEDFRAWVNLLCLTNRKGGILGSVEDIAFGLRIDEIAARSLVDRLRIATLIDPIKGGRNGKRYAPHGWEKRQYKSDSSTDRVKRFRQRSGNGEGNAPRSRSRSRTERPPNPQEKLEGNGSSEQHQGPTQEEVLEAWNDTAKACDLAPVVEVRGKRLAKLDRCLAERSFDDWARVIASIRRSEFLQGRNDREWRVTFDWMIDPENFTKIMEGHYDGQATAH